MTEIISQTKTIDTASLFYAIPDQIQSIHHYYENNHIILEIAKLFEKNKLKIL